MLLADDDAQSRICESRDEAVFHMAALSIRPLPARGATLAEATWTAVAPHQHKSGAFLPARRDRRPVFAIEEPVMQHPRCRGARTASAYGWHQARRNLRARPPPGLSANLSDLGVPSLKVCSWSRSVARTAPIANPSQHVTPFRGSIYLSGCFSLRRSLLSRSCTLCYHGKIRFL